MKHLFLKLILLLAIAMPMQAQEFFTPPYQTEPTSYDFATNGQKLDYWHPLLNIAKAHTDNTGQGIALFIVDTGGEWKHDDLPTEGNQFAINGTPEPYTDGNGHSHMCAGMIAAIDNAIGVKGAAPNVLLIPVKGMRNGGSGFSTELSKVITLIADANLGPYNSYPRVINMSFGGSSPMPDLEAALRYAISKGCILVASAGNSGYQPGGNTIGYPARYDFVISAASLDSSGNPSNFSSAGKELKVASFGSSVTTTNNQNGYSTVNGTSFSGPLVASVAALIARKHRDALLKAPPAQRNGLMMAFIKKWATDIAAPGWDERTGYGLAKADMLFNPLPEAPDDGNPPPPPPGGEYAKRSMTIPITGKYLMYWKPASGTFEDLNITLTVSYTNTSHSAAAFDKVQAATDAFWRNRGFVLLDKTDNYDALRYGRHFYELIMKQQQGLDVKVVSMTGTDVRMRSWTIDDTAPRFNGIFSKARAKRASTLLYNP